VIRRVLLLDGHHCLRNAALACHLFRGMGGSEFGFGLAAAILLDAIVLRSWQGRPAPHDRIGLENAGDIGGSQAVGEFGSSLADAG
jgi:hypothetical protein